jgi:histone-lysine N-methyltransferase SETMAR
MAEVPLGIRYAIFYEWKLFDPEHDKQADVVRRLERAFGQEAPSKMAVCRYFKRFSEGDESVEDKPRSGRPVEFDYDKLIALVEEDNRLSTADIAARLACSYNTAAVHLETLGLVRKLGRWIPHKLTTDQRVTRVAISQHLLSQIPRKEFLESIVTGDETWVKYSNSIRKGQLVGRFEQVEPEPKGDMHPKKQMLSVWWDFKGIIYWELLKPGTTITAEVYSAQLHRLRDAINRERPGRGKIRLQHDNAKPHVSTMVYKTLEEFRWEVLPHAPYSPDKAPSDYHLFRSLKNQIKGEELGDQTEVENFLRSFFSSKSTQFYHDGISQLPLRWQFIAEHNGDYCPDKL